MIAGWFIPISALINNLIEGLQSELVNLRKEIGIETGQSTNELCYKFSGVVACWLFAAIYFIAA